MIKLAQFYALQSCHQCNILQYKQPNVHSSPEKNPVICQNMLMIPIFEVQNFHKCFCFSGA